MSLGEAFIEVKADLRPFVRDLDREVKKILEMVEGRLSGMFGAGGRAAGGKFGDEFSGGFQDSTRDKMNNSDPGIFVGLASALASALDDGISALPTEVKAALIAGVISAAPVLAAMLSSVIATSIAVGAVGLGVALATQFEQVQTQWTSFISNARNTLVTAADAFGPAMLRMLAMLESAISNDIGPKLVQIFDDTAGFLLPLANGIVDFVEEILDGIADSTGDMRPFIDALINGLQELGSVIGESMEMLVETGEDGANALELLFDITKLLVMSITGLLVVSTKLVTALGELSNKMAEVIPFLGILRAIFPATQEAQTSYIESNFEAADSFNGVIAKTKEEEKALKDLVKSMDDLVDSMYETIEADIAFEESLDRIQESLKENGRTLDLDKEKGRENTEEFIRGLKAAEEQALSRLKTQGYTSAEAARLYDQDIEKLRQLANNAGISDQKFNELFGSIVDVSRLRISSEEMGVDGLTSGLDDAGREALALLNMMKTLSKITIRGAVGGALVKFADGDIVNRPTVGIFGEAGPEVVIPLTKPARAAELAEKSGLNAILGNGGTQVMVFIGNEQLESRMVQVVERSNANQATALSQGPRRF